MDACHLLFRRQWKYDLKSQHDGVKNTYTINKDGKVIELLPVTDKNQEERKEKEVKVMMMGKNDFLKSVEGENGPFFALIPILKDKMESFTREIIETNKYTNKDNTILKVESAEKKTTKIDEEVATILDKYQGIVADDMPRNLPPMKEINHYIDLIPGSTLPKK